MADGTAIGALAVRIGGDASGLISALDKSGKALSSFGKAAAAMSAVAAAAGICIDCAGWSLVGT